MTVPAPGALLAGLDGAPSWRETSRGSSSPPPLSSSSLSVFERAGPPKGAALVDRGGIGRIERRRLRLDALALRVGRIARLEIEVRGLRVVPPLARVVGHPESDGMAHPRREKRAAHQLHQVFVAQVSGEHAAILYRGKRRTDPQAHGLDAVAVEIEAREILAEAFAHAVEPVRAYRVVGIDALRLLVETDDVVGAREDHALHAVAPHRFIKVEDADDVRLQDRIEAGLEGDAAEVRHGIHALDQAQHRGLVRKLALHYLFAGAGVAERRAIRDSQDARVGLETLAQQLAEAAGGAGEQQPFESLRGGHVLRKTFS